MTVRFWNPVMKNGVIDFVKPEDCPVGKRLRETDIKPFGVEYGNIQYAEG
jgi:CRISPR-associated protein Cas5d